MAQTRIGDVGRLAWFPSSKVTKWFVLVFWFGEQILAGLPQLSSMRPDISSGVAVWAHVGGFVAGVVLVKLFENHALVRRRTSLGETF